MSKEIVKQIKPEKFVAICSKELQKMKELQMPEWAKYVKTGVHKKFPPHKDDWWYIRAASLLRRIAIDGPVGISRLRTFYGGRKERGHKPEKFRRAGGKIIRTVLQQLESAGFVEKTKQGKKGRVLTEKGRKFVAKVFSEVKK